MERYWPTGRVGRYQSARRPTHLEPRSRPQREADKRSLSCFLAKLEATPEEAPDFEIRLHAGLMQPTRNLCCPARQGGSLIQLQQKHPAVRVICLPGGSLRGEYGLGATHGTPRE